MVRVPQVYTQEAASPKCSTPMPKVVVGGPQVWEVFSWVLIHKFHRKKLPPKNSKNCSNCQNRLYLKIKGTLFYPQNHLGPIWRIWSYPILCEMENHLGLYKVALDPSEGQEQGGGAVGGQGVEL